MSVPKEGVDEELADEITTKAGGAENVGGAVAVGVVGGVTVTPGGQQTLEKCKGEGRANNKLRTVMEEMKMCEDDMDEGEVAEAEQDNVVA